MWPCCDRIETRKELNFLQQKQNIHQFEKDTFNSQSCSFNNPSWEFLKSRPNPILNHSLTHSLTHLKMHTHSLSFAHTQVLLMVAVRKE